MRKKNQYMFRTEKKKKKRALTVSLVIAGLILTAAVVWVGLNNWNLEKSYERARAEIGIIENKEADKLPEENPILDEDAENVASKLEKPEMPEEPGEPQDKETENISSEEAIQYIEDQELPEEPSYIDGVLIANKKFPLPSTFAPGENKEAREAFNKMAAAASLEDYQLVAFSTYRSFEYQTDLYNRYVERDGVEEADRYSARPGYSEHQTGLAFDIGEVNKEQDWASSRFGDAEAGKWLAENAHHYGFILRYPEGKEAITGYMYEAWHFRYVGEEIAKDIYENNITLEEYLGI